MKRFYLLLLILCIYSFSKAQLMSHQSASKTYSNGNTSILSDGKRGDADDLHTGWIGFEGTHVDFTTHFDTPTLIREVKLGALRYHDAWIFLPQAIDVITIDANNKKRTYHYKAQPLAYKKGNLKRDFTFTLDSILVRSIFIHVENLNTCPDWHPGLNQPSWFFVDEIKFNTSPTPLTNGPRGLHFTHAPYQYKALPKYDEVKDQLPQPILTENKEWLDMYWFCWKLAFNKLRTPEMGSPFVSNYIDEAFSKNIYQWDTHFMILYWKYAHHLFPAIESHDNFYACQHSNGYICREISEIDGSDYIFIDPSNTINPPLFPWVELEYSLWSQDTSRFRIILPALEQYANWIEKNRKQDSQHNLYWQTNLGSGMDNSPRRGNGWIDMSSQMALFYESLYTMSKQIGEDSVALHFQQKQIEITKNINQWMWKKEHGMYYDVNYDGIPISSTQTIASFWPFLAGVPSLEQKDRMLKTLTDTSKFWTTTPFPTLSADHPEFHKQGNYWVGGVWAPTNYMLIKGLNKYGAHDLAQKASAKYLTSMYEVFKKSGTVWENYAPLSKQEGNWSKKDFVGWTGLGPISLLIEDIIGIKLTSPNQLTWNITRTDEHGIKQLQIGNNTISMIADKRKDRSKKVSIHIVCSAPFNLHIINGSKNTAIQVKAGESILSI